MAWAGTATVWVIAGGIPTSFPVSRLAFLTEAQRKSIFFVQLSDSHIGFNKEANKDVTATLTPAQLAAILAVEVPLSVVQATGNTHNGSASWTYSIADSKFDFIAKGGYKAIHLTGEEASGGLKAPAEY